MLDPAQQARSTATWRDSRARVAAAARWRTCANSKLATIPCPTLVDSVFVSVGDGVAVEDLKFGLQPGKSTTSANYTVVGVAVKDSPGYQRLSTTLSGSSRACVSLFGVGIDQLVSSRSLYLVIHTHLIVVPRLLGLSASGLQSSNNQHPPKQSSHPTSLLYPHSPSSATCLQVYLHCAA
ncbi:hypothetical protein PGT21_014466 [Puccinia graminis f. sp. tritici]|uniref:Uncharacterized protein n=1 Tax=Puccinia graminis f. sp. tritici TaxID=56615 RepID=A0A5B0NNG2_PUCGR|nr:hypothetical protein PGT21_014466 [Puccinia graminis f. sp. tritici]